MRRGLHEQIAPNKVQSRPRGQKCRFTHRGFSGMTGRPGIQARRRASIQSSRTFGGILGKIGRAAKRFPVFRVRASCDLPRQRGQTQSAGSFPGGLMPNFLRNHRVKVAPKRPLAPGLQNGPRASLTGLGRTTTPIGSSISFRQGAFDDQLTEILRQDVRTLGNKGADKCHLLRELLPTSPGGSPLRGTNHGFDCQQIRRSQNNLCDAYVPRRVFKHHNLGQRLGHRAWGENS